MKTFELHPYPALDPAAMAAAHAAADQALSRVDEESKGQAYQAWLGYYNSSLRKMGWSQADLVAHGNEFARDVLRTEPQGEGWAPPGLLAKTVGKMGLKGVPGLNVLRGEAAAARMSGSGRQQQGQGQGQQKGRQGGQQQAQPELAMRMGGFSNGVDGPQGGGAPRGRGGRGGRGGGRGGRGRGGARW